VIYDQTYVANEKRKLTTSHCSARYTCCAHFERRIYVRDDEHVLYTKYVYDLFALGYIAR